MALIDNEWEYFYRSAPTTTGIAESFHTMFKYDDDPFICWFLLREDIPEFNTWCLMYGLERNYVEIMHAITPLDASHILMNKGYKYAVVQMGLLQR